MNDLHRSPLVRLLRDERGSFLPVFAITLLVLIAMIGMGIDYTRATLANAKMQAALDATALALSGNAATVTSNALSSEASTLFSSIYTGSKLMSPSITATYSNNGGPQVVVTGSATLPTTFLNLPPFKLSSLNLSASSTIAWGQSRLRVALVLDNTGSMADSGKISALQTATKNLLRSSNPWSSTPGMSMSRSFPSLRT
jgi:Flp pilus assembly protein TadG